MTKMTKTMIFSATALLMGTTAMADDRNFLERAGSALVGASISLENRLERGFDDFQDSIRAVSYDGRDDDDYDDDDDDDDDDGWDDDRDGDDDDDHDHDHDDDRGGDDNDGGRDSDSDGGDDGGDDD